MEQILEMKAGGVYILESKSSANSVYFETDDLAKLFFRYCDYYLKDYLNIHEYCLTQDGWVMLVKIKTAKTIRKHYSEVESRRKMKKKDSGLLKPKSIWRILSERVRLFISSYVRMSNVVLGRTGSLVGRKYSRYLCADMKTATTYVKSIRQRQVELAQTKPKYRGMCDHFRMSTTESGMKLQSSLWLAERSCVEGIMDVVREFFGAEMQVLKGLGKMVVLDSNILNKTSFPPPPKPPSP